MSESSTKSSRAGLPVPTAAAVEAAEVEDMAVGVGATRTKGTTTGTTTTTATATATTPPRPGPARQLRQLRRLTLRRRPLITPPSMRNTMAPPIRMPPTVATRPTSRCISNGQLPKPAMGLLLALRVLRVPQRRLRPRPRARPHRLLPLLLRRRRRRLRLGRLVRVDTAR